MAKNSPLQTTPEKHFRENDMEQPGMEDRYNSALPPTDTVAYQLARLLNTTLKIQGLSKQVSISRGRSARFEIAGFCHQQTSTPQTSPLLIYDISKGQLKKLW
jgi:hypothetical protein